MVGPRPSSSISTGFVASLSLLLPRWLRTGWQSVISQGKIPLNIPPWLKIKPRPRGGQTVRFNYSTTELPSLTR